MEQQPQLVAHAFFGFEVEADALRTGDPQLRENMPPLLHLHLQPPQTAPEPRIVSGDFGAVGCALLNNFLNLLWK